VFITCSISTHAPEGLVEVTDLTSSKTTSFWWAIICFNCAKVTKRICWFEALEMLSALNVFLIKEQILLVTLAQLKQIITHQKLVAFKLVRSVIPPDPLESGHLYCK